MRIIFIHGISTQPTNYSERLYDRILAACRQRLRAAGRSDDTIDATLRQLVHHEIFWAELTTDLTNRYMDLSYEHSKFFWDVLTKPLDPLFIQIMAYIHDKGNRDSGDMNILKHVESEFRRIFHADDLGQSEPATTDRKAIVIAHSLGTVIAFDYLMGFRRYQVHHSIDVKRFITMGSPIPLFTSAMGHPDSDLTLPPQIKKWINIRSPRDGVARPMKPFFRHIPIDEHLVRTSFSPLSSHDAYWTDAATADIIAAQIISSL